MQNHPKEVYPGLYLYKGNDAVIYFKYRNYTVTIKMRIKLKEKMERVQRRTIASIKKNMPDF